MAPKKDTVKKAKLSRGYLVVSRIRRKLLSRHIVIARLTILAFLLAILIVSISLVLNLFRTKGWDQYFVLAKNFLLAPKGEVAQIDGRTNILILGKAGEGYTAPDLTDTIIVASISQTKDHKITMLSLPRDIWLPDLAAKLNSVYYWGNQKKEGGGIALAKATVESIVGIPIHYAVIIDFNGFKDVIDAIGGVEINVEKSFTDTRFPIPGKENDTCGGDPEYNCRYETVTFEKGLQMMNGETALKFVRSRHSEDLEEGTDLARAKRQELVFSAIRKKLLSRDVILNPQKAKRAYDAIRKLITTDIPDPALAVLARKAYEDRNDISSYVLGEDYLENPPISPIYNNLYVFIPKGGNWDAVHKYVQGILP